MSKPMIMTLLEDLAHGGRQNMAEITDLDALQIAAALDEIQILQETAVRSGSVERGRIFAGLSGFHFSNFVAAASVVTDLLTWLAAEAGESDAHNALLRGHADFVLEKEIVRRRSTL